MNSTITTKHGLERMLERANVTEERALRMIEKAILFGKGVEDINSKKERAFMERHSDNGHVKFYNNFIYIFNTDYVLITAYPSPDWFMRKEHYDGKIKIKHPTKYVNIPARVSSHEIEYAYLN